MHFTGKILNVNKKKHILLFLNKTYFTVETYTKNGNGMDMEWVCKKFPISYLLWV